MYHTRLINLSHHFKGTHKKRFKLRYSVIGINSFNSDPDVFTKVTPELKNWIVSIVPGAQVANPNSTTGCSKL